MPFLRPLTVATGLALTAFAAAQQPVWQALPNWFDPPPTQTQTSYDSWRHRSVAVAADTVLEFDRARWRTAGGGTGWQQSAIAFDAARGVTVAFGGSQFLTADAGTREWNGSTWTLRSLPTNPPGRSRAAMAFDRARARLVLFGGNDAVLQKLGDTWEYDGTAWTQRVVAGGPAPRSHHAMAWDAQRSVVVLYGGQTTAWTNETWEWNGVAWAQHAGGPTASPSVLAYDEARGRSVLLATPPGGSSTSSWERIGTAWTQVQPQSPIQQTQAGGCFDEILDAVVASGLDFDLQPRTWRWNGTTWLPLTTELVPPLSEGVALAACPQRQSLLRFGIGAAWWSASATWEWLGGIWRIVPSTTAPPLDLAWTSMATDPTGSVLLFGGASSGTALNTTWRFTGTSWQALAPATAPPARSQHGMALDAVQGRVLLFGGIAANGALLGDTWQWDGTTWSQLAPTTSPSARANAAMAFDVHHNAMLLFGGGAWNGTTLADFWRWNGSTWQAIGSPSGPTTRARAVMAYDRGRQRTVVTGGFTMQLFGPGPAQGSWEWDGAAWSAIGGTQPPAHAGTIGAFDLVTGRVVVYTIGAAAPAGVWQLGAASVATTNPFGSACPGSSGAPVLRSFGLPQQGNPLFALHATSLLPGAPVVFGLGTQPANVPLGGGCTLLVAAPELGFAIADPAGVARLDLPLPAGGALHGASFVAQAAALDPIGPFAQFAFTAGLQCTID